MPRLAHGRQEYLTSEEIARVALAQFDEAAGPPSIRRLAAGLGVSPTAIYYHFPAQAQIIWAAVDLVFTEAEELLLDLVPNPFDLQLDPVEVLVSSGIATRRAFMRHHRIAPFVAATPLPTGRLVTTIEFMSEMFGRLGLSDDDSAEAFHTFSSYVIGAVIFAATRVVANEQLGRSGEGNATISGASAALAPPHPASSRGRAMEAMVDVSVRDPQLDEDLFAHGLRRLLASFAATAAPRTGGPPIEA